MQRPRTRSAAARQMSNAHERDRVTNENVRFRPCLGQPYIFESLSFDSVRVNGYKSQRVDG